MTPAYCHVVTEGRGSDPSLRDSRRDRAAAADALCAQAYAAAAAPEVGVALVAVGGYGRGELAPYSDLDVVLVHDDGVELGEWATDLWYPLWDSGWRIDHSVRSPEQMLTQATDDLRVALGLLDLRHLAGDPALTVRLRSAVLTQWRRDARTRLPELREMLSERARTQGELAHVAVPDLKASVGGLRDTTVLKGLVASWLVDVSHPDLDRVRRSLLDVRDALHTVADRQGDRIGPEHWDGIAEQLGEPDAVAAQIRVRSIGRRLTHLTRLTMARAEAVLRQPSRNRRPALRIVEPGIALAHDEVVLAPKAAVSSDPLLLLTCAAVAAEQGAILAPSTVARLVRDGARLPNPWPVEARDLLCRLLGAGSGLIPVWETLDETGAIATFLPEWDQIRLLPHASAIHRFTVDRHVIETCAEASMLLTRVARPDVLLVAALVHDIGKGQLQEHCVAGAPIAEQIATRMGFSEADCELIGWLVRWHLLLPEVATARDLEDPQTIAGVRDVVRRPDQLDLLAALTEADARAASEQAWSTWRAGLIRHLVSRVRADLTEQPAVVEATRELPPGIIEQLHADADGVVIEVVDEAVSIVRVIAADRAGLLADVAAMLVRARVGVHAMRAWTEAEIGVSEWRVSQRGLQPALLRRHFAAVLDDQSLSSRSHQTEVSGDPVVLVRPSASTRATVLEVRCADAAGLLHTVLSTLADLAISVASAHVETIGAQAVDSFYLQEPGAAALTDARAASAARAVRRSLEVQEPVRLGR